MSQELVDARLVGVIGKPHGIKGEVNVMLLTDYPDSILKGSVLFLDEGCTEEITVENIRTVMAKGRQTAVIKFAGIADRDDAGGLRGRELFRSSQDSPELESGQFWADDLEGCSVYLADNTELGTVEKVDMLPANDNLLIRPLNGKDMVYIPMVDEYIDSIDIKNKKVVIKKLPEYI